MTSRKCIVVTVDANGDVLVLPTRGNAALMGMTPLIVIQPHTQLERCADGNGPEPFKIPSHFYVEKRARLRPGELGRCLAHVGQNLTNKVRVAVVKAERARQDEIARRERLRDRGE